jgi:hypothetical protein
MQTYHSYFSSITTFFKLVMSVSPYNQARFIDALWRVYSSRLIRQKSWNTGRSSHTVKVSAIYLYGIKQELNEICSMKLLTIKWQKVQPPLTGLQRKWQHSLIMLVYNIKRSNNILAFPIWLPTKMELTYKAKILYLLQTKYIKVLDFILPKLNLQPKKRTLKGLIWINRSEIWRLS